SVGRNQHCCQKGVFTCVFSAVYEGLTTSCSEEYTEHKSMYQSTPRREHEEGTAEWRVVQLAARRLMLATLRSLLVKSRVQLANPGYVAYSCTTTILLPLDSTTRGFSPASTHWPSLMTSTTSWPNVARPDGRSVPIARPVAPTAIK